MSIPNVETAAEAPHQIRKQEACVLLELPMGTFERLRVEDPSFPQPVHYNQRVIRWVREELLEWRAANQTRIRGPITREAHPSSPDIPTNGTLVPRTRRGERQ